MNFQLVKFISSSKNHKSDFGLKADLEFTRENNFAIFKIKKQAEKVFTQSDTVIETIHQVNYLKTAFIK